MKMLTVPEYNEQVKAFFPDSWAQMPSKKGFVYITNDFDCGAWGKTQESAIKKFRRARFSRKINENYD